MHAEIPAVSDFAISQRIGFHAEIRQGEDHAAVVERNATRVYYQHAPQLLGINLVGMADDEHVVFQTGQGLCPVGGALGHNITVAIAQLDSTVLFAWLSCSTLLLSLRLTWSKSSLPSLLSLPPGWRLLASQHVTSLQPPETKLLQGSASSRRGQPAGHGHCLHVVICRHYRSGRAIRVQQTF